MDSGCFWLILRSVELVNRCRLGARIFGGPSLQFALHLVNLHVLTAILAWPSIRRIVPIETGRIASRSLIRAAFWQRFMLRVNMHLAVVLIAEVIAAYFTCGWLVVWIMLLHMLVEVVLKTVILVAFLTYVSGFVFLRRADTAFRDR